MRDDDPEDLLAVLRQAAALHVEAGREHMPAAVQLAGAEVEAELRVATAEAAADAVGAFLHQHGDLDSFDGAGEFDEPFLVFLRGAGGDVVGLRELAGADLSVLVEGDRIEEALGQLEFATAFLLEDTVVGFGGVGAAADEFGDDREDIGGRAAVAEAAGVGQDAEVQGLGGDRVDGEALG